MSGHTPGPWEAYVRRGIVDVHREGEPRRVIVAWPGFDSAEGDDATKAANARLIAAAPDLLTAAKLVLASFNESHSLKCPAFRRPEAQCDPDQCIPGYARAAIAKAEGRP